MPDIIKQQQDQYYWLFDKAYIEDISAPFFQHDFWHNRNAVVGTEHGRGTTLFVAYQGHEFVLRHYLRGGLVSKFNKDKYLFKGWDRCRSVEEFNILLKLREMDLPVPQPIAAQVIRKGSRYQADILIERVEGACDLLGMLKDVSQSAGFYQSLAQVIARFHKAGVYHADLNIQNILIDKSGHFWLIDFDRAKILTPDRKWQMRTIQRLKRSFEKELGRHNIHWCLSEWEHFECAYLEAME